jgi:hypothetical protein
LRESDRHASASRARARTRDLLVACEFALGVVLLFAATLLLRSYIRVQSAEIGYRADNVFMASISRNAGAGTSGQSFFEPLLERLKQLPGVIDAGTVNAFIIDWNPDQVITTEERVAVPSVGSQEQLDSKWVSPAFSVP